jgi:hypothetical protein
MGYIIIIIITQVPDFIPSSLILSWAEISTVKNTKISGLKYLKRKPQDKELWNKDNTENHASFVAVGIGSTPLPFSPSPCKSAQLKSTAKTQYQKLETNIPMKKVPISTFMCL